jgi:hypothetical protein
MRLAHTFQHYVMVCTLAALGFCAPLQAQPYNASVEKAIARAHQDMLAQLGKQYPRDKLVTHVEPGQFNTVVATAAFPAAYPGTGVLRQIIDIDSGVAYGGRAEKSFGDFARERGWLARPPDTDPLIRMLNTALFEGVAIIDLGATPIVTANGNELRIQIVQRYVPTLSGDVLVVTVPAQGRETLTRTPAPPRR